MPDDASQPDNPPYEWKMERIEEVETAEAEILSLSRLIQPVGPSNWTYAQPELQATAVINIDSYAENGPDGVLADWLGDRFLNTALGLTGGLVNWAQDPIGETRLGILVGPNLNDWRAAYAESSQMWQALQTTDTEYAWNWSASRLWLDVTGLHDPVVGWTSRVAEAGGAGARCFQDSDLTDDERTWACLVVTAFGFETGATVAGVYSLARMVTAPTALAASPADEMVGTYAPIPRERIPALYDPEFAAWQAAHSGDAGHAAYLLYNPGATLAALPDDTVTLYRFVNNAEELKSYLGQAVGPEEYQRIVEFMSPDELQARGTLHSNGVARGGPNTMESPFVATLRDPKTGALTRDPTLNSIMNNMEYRYELAVPTSKVYNPGTYVSGRETEALVLSHSVEPYVVNRVPNPFKGALTPIVPGMTVEEYLVYLANTGR